MPIAFSIPSTEEEYVRLVEQFSGLVDAECRRLEGWVDGDDLASAARALPSLISLVNSVGYLRGQDNVFVDVRPRTTRQRDLYANEDAFEKRLQSIIDKIVSSPERDALRRRLEEYFVRARTNQQPGDF